MSTPLIILAIIALAIVVLISKGILIVPQTVRVKSVRVSPTRLPTAKRMPSSRPLRR